MVIFLSQILHEYDNNFTPICDRFFLASKIVFNFMMPLRLELYIIVKIAPSF